MKLHNYRIKYKFVDGDTMSVEVYDKSENLEEYTDLLSSTTFVTYMGKELNKDETIAKTVNNRNVISMEVQEIE